MILIITRKLGIEGYAAFFKFFAFYYAQMDFNLYLLTRFSNEDSQTNILRYINLNRYFIYYKYINSWNSFENKKI